MSSRRRVSVDESGCLKASLRSSETANPHGSSILVVRARDRRRLARVVARVVAGVDDLGLVDELAALRGDLGADVAPDEAGSLDRLHGGSLLADLHSVRRALARDL